MRSSKLSYRFFSIFVIISQLIGLLPISMASAQTLDQPLAKDVLQSDTDPDSLTNPLSIARVQSSYVAGTPTVEFIIANNLPPTRLPELTGSETITDTVEILASFVITDDVNTLRNVSVQDTLANGTTLMAASGNPSQNGGTLTWTIPDIPPMGSVILTMTVASPAQGTDFLDLDTGAQVSVDHWGQQVTSSARPANLIPSGIDAALTEATVDADSFDVEMLWKSAEFTQDPLAMFDYVKSLGYDPYKGSLRGTRGTLWGEAGNSADQSSLLIAMLRAAGVPARYRHGSLSTANAQVLIGSMFPIPGGVAGSIPNGTPVADPMNDPDLIARVADHWWAEAYLPGLGWTNLDPSFSNALPGDVFATPGGDDRIAELSDNIRHKITFKLEVEQYSEFPIAGSSLVSLFPVDVTFSTVELASRPLTFGHLVETEAQGGLISNVIHTYTPYFTVEGTGEYILGDSFQDFLTNFPLSSIFTTAAWLTIESQDADGNIEAFTREVKDLIGLDVRLNGGNLNLALPAGNGALFGPGDVFAMWFLPNTARNNEFTQRYRNALFARGLVFAGQVEPALELFGNSAPSPEEFELLRDATLAFQLSRARFMAQDGLDFAQFADLTKQQIEDGLRVRMFYSQPRIITLGAEYDTVADTVRNTLDLRTTRAETIVYPGQAPSAAFTANWLKGVSESYQEGQALERFTGQTPLTTARIFDEMVAQGVSPLLITPANMDVLDLYPLEREAYAYAVEALLEGKNILIPSAPVLVDGESVIGWWEIDPLTGETISVLENGLHLSALEWTFISIGFGAPFTFEAVWSLRNSVKEIWDYVVCHVVPALGGTVRYGPTSGSACTLEDPFSLPWPFSCSFCNFTDFLEGLEPTVWMDLPAYQCPVDNCGVERFVFGTARSSPIPLPDMKFLYMDTFSPQARIGGKSPVVDNGGGGAPVLTLSTTPGSSVIQPEGVATFDIVLDANFNDDVQVTAYTPGNWFIYFQDEDTIEIAAPSDSMPDDYTVVLVAQSNQNPTAFDVYEHSVTVSPVNTTQLAITQEPLITVPMGDAALDDVSNQTNDAEAEIPGSAYMVEIWNQTASETTYDVTVSGAPADWILLNGLRQNATSVTVSAGARARLGMYVSPPSGPPPAPGTAYNLTVNVTGGSFVGNQGVAWTMPAQAFNFHSLEPETLYLGEDSSADFSIQMTNIGNGDGTFPFQAETPPISATVSGLPSPILLAVGETQSYSATLTSSNLSPGLRFPIVLGSPAPGSYTQYAILNAQIVSDVTEPVFIASDNAEDTCTLGEPGLSAALEALALAMVHLEASCQSGGCALTLRDQAVSAAASVALYAGAASSLVTEDDVLVAIAADLAARTDDADILSDLAAISATVIALDSEICELSEHLPSLRWTPGYGAALVGQTSNYTLSLMNKGTMTTSYTLTVALPSGTQVFTPTLPAGATNSYAFPLSSATIGLFDLDATATVIGQSNILDQASARLNVVDRFVQLTSVTPNPDFVDVGTSSTTVFIDVSNIANIALPVTARTTIQAPTGAVNYTADQPVTVLVGTPRTYELQTVDTSGWTKGVYTVTVELLDAADALVPDGNGYGYLGVGQSLGVSHAVSPVIVPPGTVTVTTQITTEILVTPLITQTLIASPVADEALLGESALPSVLSEETVPPPELRKELLTTFAITRTEDSDPSIVYSGTWVTVTSSVAQRASNGDYTESNTPGDTAAFNFTGTWVHLGFATDQDGGEAEIFIDGLRQGTVDTYTRDNDVANFIFGNLVDTTHTLTVTVLGTAHPNADRTEVKLDFVDTWNSTFYPDGTFEQDNARVWRSGQWTDVSDPVASGGSYMQDGGNTGTAWFPFTGDSISFMALADRDAQRVGVWIDGVWQGNPLIYNNTPITRTFSFTGFGPGPHVLYVRNYEGEPNVDAFITPALGPDYDPPSYTGLVRYEEDHPALQYNGEDYRQRPNSWVHNNSAQSSDFRYMSSAGISDTVSMTFDGSWLNIGLRTRNRGGLAEVVVDGVSLGQINSYDTGENVRSYQFDLITGTHTLTITVLGQSDPPNIYNQVYLDYIEFWDATPVTDAFQNAQRGEETGRVHVSGSVADVDNANAIQGDYVASGLPNSNANVWYIFVGDSFTFFGVTVNNGGSAEVYVDGQLIDTVSFDYPFSVQPYAFHYTGFSSGPHVVRVHNVSKMRVDGFEANPDSLASFQPIVEWYDNISGGASIWGGLHVPVAVGDVTGDGNVELVVASSDINNSGTLFLMRGDGGDTGDGDPIIWSIPYNIFNGFEHVAAPTIAELDGQPGAEIIHATVEGVYAYHSDGSTYWMTDTLQSHVFFAAPAVGNLDLDPEPEIAINLSDSMTVFENDGTVAWSRPTIGTPSMPILADLTGDGLLDILFQDGDTLNLYDYNFGSPVLTWSQTFTTSLGVYGAPAVADIDGLQPGGDPGPEIAISSDGWTHVLDADGSFIWSTPLDPGNPGGVSIADLDGDGEVELVTTMLYNGGRIYALNADGSVLWNVEALDNSSLTASVMDLNGDGVYEVAWNGATGGFTLFNGADGSVLFNEDHPGVISKTGSDYPVFADVDLDGYAEVVVASQAGLRVFGWDTVWGPARPLWNQHSYHITNVNDDLTVPYSEPNSWEVHNSYRTQTSLRYPLPAHVVSLTHTVGITDVTVLTGTFSTPPDMQAYPDYEWVYTQSWADPVITRTFDLRVSNLQPGESRMVGQGTSVDYTLPSGANHLELPPLYVSVPHIVSVDPPIQTVGSGVTTAFTVTLTNPGGLSSVYDLSFVGLPNGWGALPDSVSVPAQASVAVNLTVTVPVDAELQSWPFNVGVTTDLGGNDQAGGILNVLGPVVEVGVSPFEQSVQTGGVVTYTLAVTNLEPTDRTYALSSVGVAGVALPAQIDVSASGVQTTTFTAQAVGEGANPFTVIATELQNGGRGQDTATVIGEGFWQVNVALNPETAPSGPSVLTPFDVIITNLGNSPETYDLNVSVPAGWAYDLNLFGTPVSFLQVVPGLNNDIILQLLVTPAAAATPGDYEFTVTAQSQVVHLLSPSNLIVSDSAIGTVQIGSLGVDLAITSGPPQLPPDGSGTWQVQITNTGSQADTYDLAAFGPLAAFANLSPASVTLNPGASQTVQMSISGFGFALAQDYLIGVHAQSQTQGGIEDEDTTTLSITEQQGVEVVWQPASQSISGTTLAAFTLIVTNTGNVNATFQFEVSSSAGVDIQLPLTALSIPPRSAALLLVSVDVPGNGTYLLTGTADSGVVQGSDTATLTVGGVTSSIYIPIVKKQAP